MHITPVGGNVFADLGFESVEAAALKAESQRIISEMLAEQKAKEGPQTLQADLNDEQT